jgi:hypothetical protein
MTRLCLVMEKIEGWALAELDLDGITSETHESQPASAGCRASESVQKLRDGRLANDRAYCDDRRRVAPTAGQGTKK